MILLMLLAAALQISPPIKAEKPIVQNGQKSKVADKAETSESEKSPPPITVNHPDSAQQPPSQTQTGEFPPDSRVYKIEVVAQPKPPYDPLPLVSIGINAAIALAAFGTLCVLWKQTKATEVAANAAKASADAAFQNAVAIVNAERAWIDIALPESESERGKHEIVVRNHGKTPGRIHDYEFGVNTIAPLTSVQSRDLPQPRLTVPINIFIGPNETRTLDAIDIRDYFGEEWLEVEAGRKAGIFQIIVHYRHIVTGNSMRESRMVYKYIWFSSPRWEPLREYTDYT